MAQVQLKHVSKSYGGFEAVRDVNLDVGNSEFVVLVGPSGCGKTTTLRMIAGLESITSGELKIDGRVVNDLRSKDRDVAMVFQNYALYPHMSVFENVAFGLRMRKRPEAEVARSVGEAAELLGISELLKRFPWQLSGGQRQRVALGRSIVRHPKVFLFDEPLSNLDAKLRVLMRVELRKLHQRLATTSVYVTHDQVEAMTLGDRVVVMKEGSIQQVGAPLDLYNAPANKFVAGFLGSPTMNFLTVRIEGREGALVATTEGIELELPKSRPPLPARYAGREVTLGIRPEDLSVGTENAPARQTFGAAVEVVEQLGSETLLVTRVGNDALVVSIDPTTRIKPGDPLRISVNPERILLFDLVGGETI